MQANSTKSKMKRWDVNRPEKKISVFLAIGETPAVRVDSMVWGRPKMRFVRDMDGDDFKFVSFLPDDGTPFSNIITQKNQISLENDGVAGEYIYTLKVMDTNGVEHSSSEHGPPAADRPVIRN